jgi:hypothetical protein
VVAATRPGVDESVFRDNSIVYADRMGRHAAVGIAAAVFLVLTAHREAAAAPCQNCGALTVYDTATGPTRALWIGWAATVNVAFTAGDAFALARNGETHPTVTGVQFVMSLPVAVYGIDFVRRDTSDPVAWGLTVWSIGLMAHGFWPVLAGRFGRSDDAPPKIDGPRPRKMRVGPAAIVGPDQRMRPGLSLGGTF